MKRKDLLQAYQDCSSKASDVGRQLAYAGIAVVWIFRVGEGSSIAFPSQLLASLLLFAISLGCDLLQYASHAGIFGFYHRRKELQRTHAADDKDFDIPKYLNWPAIMLFWNKLVAVTAGQIILISFIANEWRIVT